MLEWIAGLIPALPLVAALWIGIAIWFRSAHGEAHERRTSRIALTACTVSLAAALVLAGRRSFSRRFARSTVARPLAQ